MNKSALLGWGLGSFTTSVLINTVGLLQLRFMVDSLGIGIGVAGTLVALSKIYDAATDPVMGMICDQTVSRWGRYRPYLLAGGPLAALSLVLLFNVPAAAVGRGLVAYMALMLLLFSTAYTMFRIPYLAMGAELTRGFDQRSQLMTFSVYGSSLGGLFATSAAPFLLSRIGSDRAGHGTVACLLSVLIAVGGVACAALTRAPTSPTRSRPHISLRDRIAILRKSRPFLLLIGFKLTMFSGLALHATVIPFYTRHVLRATDSTLGMYFLCHTLAMMSSQFLWVRLARRLGRRNALILAALCETFLMLSWIAVPTAHPMPWVLLLGAAEGTASGGLFFGLYTVLGDVMTHERERGATEREGVFAGIFVMVEKITSAIGTAVFSGILAAVGYVSDTDSGAAAQAPAVAASIIVALAAIPAAAAILACVVFRHYELSSDGQAARILAA